MLASFTHIRTHDGTTIVRCAVTGQIASGRSLAEAVAELRRLLSMPRAA